MSILQQEIQAIQFLRLMKGPIQEKNLLQKFEAWNKLFCHKSI